MTLFPKKHPWVVMVVLYALIIAGWATFIVLAKQRHTTRLSPEEANEVYQNSLKEKQLEAEGSGQQTTETP
ncbi:hypothetical protein HW115_13965 [Verrucomicrobiaceae bacterium N1E253]|uniref:Uncharacterized protein n=1 Tax=Oceaniferula marina TaxID=2748318 RepID=A0A851GNL9_9BACT|nr:hypothetical protein [Oceaniferula marina]NWK56725.1 hypothetical protein [Oceaniferula marina]